MKSRNFDTFPQPEWNTAGSIALALESLRNAHDQSSSNKAYDRFLYAVGNNHAGTYYPIVLATLPELKQLLIGGGFWSQYAVMESLIDLGVSFVPKVGYELHDGITVQRALHAEIRSMRPHVLLLVGGRDARSKSASDLIKFIDDQPA